MMVLPWVLCGILLVAVVILSIKVWLLKWSMDEICTEFREHVSMETNTLISTSSLDRHVRKLAAELSKQLRLLRKQQQRYLNGQQALKESVTNISHDLRTPLTAIRGYVELLEQEEQSPRAKQHIEVIKNRTEVLERLTEELFQYAVVITVESGEEKEDVIINDVLEESIAAFYTELNEHGIHPAIQLAERKVIRTLNRSALSRVFANLLHNAVKYSDGDLEVTLSETGRITFTNIASAFNEVQVGKLFDRFYTVEDAQNSTGLGLAIARTLVEQMNGTISAQYQNGRLRICISF